MSTPLVSAQDGPRISGMATKKSKLRTGSIPSGPGKGKFPVKTQKDVADAARLAGKAKGVSKSAVVEHIKAEAAKRGLDLPASWKHTKPKSRKSVKLANDGTTVDLGMHGSKWRHGWIPQNAIATQIKLKKFGKGGKSEPGKVAAKTRPNVSSLPSGPGRTKAAPPKVKAKPTSLGKAPDTAISTKPDVFGSGIREAAAHRERQLAEYHKEHGSVTVREPIPNGWTRSQVENKIRRDNPGIAGLDKVDVQREEGRLPGWTHFIGPGRSAFHPDQSTHERVRAMTEGKPGATIATREGNIIATQRHIDATKKESRMAKAKTPVERVIGSGTYQHENGHAYRLHTGLAGSGGAGSSGVGSSVTLERHDGAVAGHITPLPSGKLRIESYNGTDVPPHEVNNREQAIRGLVLGHDLALKRKADEAASRDAETKARQERYLAEAKAKDAERAALRKARDANEARIHREAAERNRKQMLTVKPPKRSNTTKDTATMQKQRAALEARLRDQGEWTPNVHGQHPSKFEPGMQVSIVANEGRRDAHVTHADSGMVHTVSTNPETGKREMHVIHAYGRGDKRKTESTADLVDGQANKQMVEKGMARDAARFGQAANRGSGQYRSGAKTLHEHLAKADAEFRKRMDARKKAGASK